MPKKYTKSELIEKYRKLSNPKKVEVLENALGLMESNNSQSQENAIIRGMGYEYDFDGGYYKTKSP